MTFPMRSRQIKHPKIKKDIEHLAKALENTMIALPLLTLLEDVHVYSKYIKSMCSKQRGKAKGGKVNRDV